MHAQLEVSIGQSSHRGVKDSNEDSYGVLCPTGSTLTNKGITAILADGMGSCAHPKEASEYCVKGFLSDYYSTPESWTVKSSGAKVLTALNNWLYAKTHGNNAGTNDARGMVSTFSALVIKSNTAHVFHIGDSRIYRYRDGNLEQLTQDHRVWFSKNKSYLSRAVGIDLHLDIDYRSVDVQLGDLLLMTSDGVHDYIPDPMLRDFLNSSSPLDVIADNIIVSALDKGSNDNVTCQILRIDSLPEQDANEVYNNLTRLPFPPELEPGMVLDGYRVIEEISASPTSQLYLVEDTEDGTRMVMKTPSVNFDDDPSYIERFHMEEWAGKRIDHPNVIRILNQTRPRNFMYFLMEHVEGISLKQWMQNHPRPDIREVTGIIEQIIHGLRAIHRMEMLHRDLKPDNIMIQNSDNPEGVTDRNRVKIIDLGSIKVAGIQEISTPVQRIELLGTKNYTAPEYLIGMPGTPRSELFSLGVICYEMLTGALPYGEKLNRNTSWRKLHRIRYIPAPTRNPMVPPWLDSALEKAVHCDQRMRYDSFSEFFRDLNHPNEAFNREYVPFVEKNPASFWKGLALISLLANLLLIYFLATNQ